MLSLANGKKPNPVSTHGKALLSELLTPASANLEVTLSYIEKDAMAGRLKDADTGNNSFHLLLGSDHSSDFVIPVLRALLEKCPEGCRAANKKGSFPLHLCLSQQDIILEAAGMLLRAYPAAAGHANKQGLIPLFLCVMRDNSNIELCRALCQSFAAGPATPNATKSLPLHFAAKRWRPNKELLKLLLKRNPSAASVFNEFGFLPLHCACSTTDDIEAVKMIYEAYPEAIKMKDRQGKTCLHLAVLAVGHDHEQAVRREEELEHLQRELEAKALKLQIARKAEEKNAPAGTKKAKPVAAAMVSPAFDNDSEDDDDENDRKETEAALSNEINERDGSRSRKVIQFLISQWPEALVTDNNFMATPVETVLEKARRIKCLSRRISIFGLFDDPPTARLLLNAQKYRAEKRLLPPLRPRFYATLRELNWLARRDAIMLSSIGEKRTIGNTDNTGKIRLTVGGNIASAAELKQKSKVDSRNHSKKAADKGKTKKDMSKVAEEKKPDCEASSGVIIVIGDDDIPRNNILARFRRRGYMDIVRQCVSWI